MERRHEDRGRIPTRCGSRWRGPAGCSTSARGAGWGPAAWGMTGRPELERFDRLGVGLRVEPRPVDAMNEPPSRTFSYTLRPTRPGEAVLPPVAIAAFDPATRRYVTHVTPGVPIRVV